MTPLVEGAVTILLAVVGVALASVILSRNSQTPAVLQAGFSGFGNALGVAESPVTGAKISYSLGYPAPSTQAYMPGS